MAEVPRYEDYFTPDGQPRLPYGAQIQPQVPLRRRLARTVTRDLPIALSAIPAGRMAAGGIGLRAGPGLMRTTAGGARTPPPLPPNPNAVLRGPYEVKPDVPIVTGRLQALGARLASELAGLGLRYGATRSYGNARRRNREADEELPPP